MVVMSPPAREHGRMYAYLDDYHDASDVNDEQQTLLTPFETAEKSFFIIYLSSII
jgi:hypothetical protein